MTEQNDQADPWSAGWAPPDPVEESEREIRAYMAAPREVRGDVARWLRKPEVERLQLDGWANQERGDPVMMPDDEGDVRIVSTVRDRHGSGTDLRIWINPDAAPVDVLRLATKLLDWYRKTSEEYPGEVLMPAPENGVGTFTVLH
jgi:hypothetical protein